MRWSRNPAAALQRALSLTAARRAFCPQAGAQEPLLDFFGFTVKAAETLNQVRPACRASAPDILLIFCSFMFPFRYVESNCATR